MKSVKFNGEIFKSERICKGSNYIVGYTGDIEVFSFTGISDFSLFQLLDGAEYDVDESQSESTATNVLGAEHVKLDLSVLNLKRQVASLTIEMNKQNSEISELTKQNQVLGSLLSSLQAQVLAIKGGTDVNV